ncbi:hypothetical protein D3Z17_09395 [Bacillus subtilis]|uniref:ApeA N-terminal domain 1-containing protein n=4 Tax=Bacillus subtilis TaxID=1423 RepID=UPI000EA36998|nr:HEPN domain-containing protein [Bacillus subtilis]AYF11312.1 hypothetical protein D3Z17_09395 [Bacillus subtilis]WIW62982.1 hypothetical protein LSG27_12310 [Bacillus subtilis]
MTKAVKQSRESKFEIKGLWWTNDYPERIPGVLIYSNDEIRLELTGVIGDKELFSTEREAPKIICGYSSLGESFRLIPNLRINKRHAIPGFPTEAYSIREFIAGVFEDNDYLTLDEMNFESAVFNTDYLTSWMSQNVLEREHYIEPKPDQKAMTVNYFKPLTKTVYIEKLKSNLTEDYISQASQDEHTNLKFIITHTSRFVLTPETNKNLQWFKQNINIFRDLLSILMGFPIKYIDFILYDNHKGTEKRKLKYFSNMLEVDTIDRIHRDDFIVNYQSISENFDTVVNKWYDNQSIIKTVSSLYLYDYYTNSYIESRFLTAVQSLEIYHRKKYSGKNFPDDLYESSVKQIKELIDENLPVEVREAFKSKFNYGNEFSLNKRLKEIFNNLEDETIVMLIGDTSNVKKFNCHLVDTRNYLTHYDAKKKKFILDDVNGKFYAMEIIKALTTILLFKEIGLSENFIRTRILQSKKFRGVLPLARKNLNLTQNDLV